jgi:hypothetical protein
MGIRSKFVLLGGQAVSFVHGISFRRSWLRAIGWPIPPLIGLVLRVHWLTSRGPLQVQCEFSARLHE